MFIPLYRFFKRPVKIYEVFLKSLDWKLFLNVLFILYFIQILTNIGTFDQIVSFFKSSPLPESVIIACLSFIFGLMTGMNQAFIAIVVPIVAIMDPGNALLVGTTIVFGQAGQMITPTHMCVLITVDYFKSDMGRTIWKCGVLSFWLVTLYSLVEFCRYLLSSLAWISHNENFDWKLPNRVLFFHFWVDRRKWVLFGVLNRVRPKHRCDDFARR